MSEIWNLSALCRCCHAGDGVLRSLEAPHVYDGAIEIYSVLLRDTFGLHVNPPTIEASYSICESCIELLHLGHRFKKQVQACEKKFHEYCENEQTINTSDDIKIEVDNDNVIINSGVNIENGFYVVNDDCDNVNDSDGGYSEMDSEFEGTGQKSDGEEKNEIICCQFCNESFKNTESWRSHVFEAHVADGLSCKICKRTYKCRSLLRRHFDYGHKIIWQCSFCGEVLTSSFERDRHEQNEHVKTTGYVCDHCQMSFRLKLRLINHMTWHTLTNEFVCESCGRSFKKKFALKTHIETVHENKRRFQCDQCEKAYKCKKSLILHSYSHTGEFPFKCNTCSKGFKTKTNLRYHKELMDHDIDGENEVVGWKFGANLDDDGVSDSDGGYENNDDNGNESETEIDKENRIENEMESEKIEVTVGSPVDDSVTAETEDFVYDSADDGEERKHNTNQQDEIGTKTSDEPKTKDKPKGKQVQKTKQVEKANNAYYEIEFTCVFCQKKFTSTKTLRRHFSDRHVTKDLSCPLCNSSFTVRRHFIKHLMSKHLKSTFHCQYCIETFNTKKGLQKHHVVHTQNGYTCDCCGKKFKWKRTLIRHLASQMGMYEPHTCGTCGRTFKQLGNLKAHIKVVHDKLRPLKCDFCDKRYSLKKHLDCHIRWHTGERPFRCNICSKAYRSSYYLKTHRLRHEKNKERKEEKKDQRKEVVKLQRPIVGQVQCNICGKKYTNYTIKQHMANHMKPFKCDLCNCAYSKKSLLINHKILKHLPEEEMGVRCNLCREYFTKETIKLHMSKHEVSVRGRPLSKCKICNKNYFNWEIHKKIHDRKPFKCHICGRMYAEKIKLDAHVEGKHFKERNYSCDMCNKKYTSMDSLSIHKKRKHSGDTQAKKKERKKIIKKSKLPIVKLEKLDIDSVLPAFAVPKKA